MSRASSSSSSSCPHRLAAGGGRRGLMTVADVYDMAADIGKEFELVIDSHGPEHISGLMQKVISALEHLERFAAEADAEEENMEQLRSTITHLEREEAKKNEERQRITKVGNCFYFCCILHCAVVAVLLCCGSVIHCSWV